MDHFSPSNSHFYILVCLDYVTKWIEMIDCAANDAHIVSKFLKNNIFIRFGVSRVLVSDEECISAINMMSTLFLNS